MMEAGVVLGPLREALYWHVPNGRTGGSLPDSHSLWEVLWESREQITGFAHSHPGKGDGSTHPSVTDLTTFKAIELGLGKSLDWFIVSQDQIAVCRLYKNRFDFMNVTGNANYYQSWIDELRRRSGF